MNYPGDYAQPLVRTTNVHCPIVGGYYTARLQVMGNPLNSTSGFVDNTTAVVLENVGSNTVVVQLTGCNDYTSGPRENLGASKTVVPRGRATYSVTPRHTYLEVRGLSGTSALRVQLSSRLLWNELGFDKRDAFYPPSLWLNKTPLTTAV